MSSMSWVSMINRTILPVGRRRGKHKKVVRSVTPHLKCSTARLSHAEGVLPFLVRQSPDLDPPFYQSVLLLQSLLRHTPSLASLPALDLLLGRGKLEQQSQTPVLLLLGLCRPPNPAPLHPERCLLPLHQSGSPSLASLHLSPSHSLALPAPRFHRHRASTLELIAWLWPISARAFWGCYTERGK